MYLVPRCLTSKCMFSLYRGAFFLFFCLWTPLVVCASPPDVVAIIPDRSTAYPNGLHNGLLASAFRYNITLEVRDVGDFNPEESHRVLQDAIERQDQPKIYLIWPVDIQSLWLMKDLFNAQGVPIIQLNQLPSAETDWEWDYLLGYAGPDDSLRARNAGHMMIQALQERGIQRPNVVALGYPSNYGGYHLSIEAFRESIESSDIQISHDLPLDWGNQPAYDAIVHLMDELKESGQEIHGVYAMDDNILIGAYEALNDRGKLDGEDPVVLVGTVCNGHREILATGQQYGTTIQSPYLEAALAVDSAVEYLSTGELAERVRFTPNPMATTETWETMILSFLGEAYMADGLCTWNLLHERRNGLQNVEDANDVCDYADCLLIPDSFVVASYWAVGLNYVLCGAGFVLLYLYRNKKVVALAQPFFLGLVLFGAMVDTTSILFMYRDSSASSQDQLDRSCLTWSWLLTLGQMMTFTTLVAKMTRVKAVVGMTESENNSKKKRRKQRPSMRRTRVNRRDVSGLIIGGLLVDLVVLTIWLIQDPFHWMTTVVSRDFQNTILQARGECSSEGDNYWAYPFLLLVLHLSVLVYGNILAWQTRKYHKISDSRMVAVSLFNSIQLLLVASIMLSLSGDNVTISYVIRVCYAFLNNIGVILFVVAPKLYHCILGKGDVLPSMNLAKSSRNNNATIGNSRNGNYQPSFESFVSGESILLQSPPGSTHSRRVRIAPTPRDSTTGSPPQLLDETIALDETMQMEDCAIWEGIQTDNTSTSSPINSDKAEKEATRAVEASAASPTTMLRKDLMVPNLSKHNPKQLPRKRVGWCGDVPQRVDEEEEEADDINEEEVEETARSNSSIDETVRSNSTIDEEQLAAC